ncbi:DUF262 domain-containing protein [Burkholderia cenocepacia]|nr:DUF262 domain-containing protein [Burkholderia cenocepacia]RQZ96188.1 DUF262 domain-containing protein [Burkholderia cenocepacia]RRA16423.1 DUF262 domain-containing protein [Burkholderia cenocepacia]
MRFIPAEPDIATVFRRISDGDIDLQPDFQRGEVWPTAKKQRLIDSILRGWVVPPVLLISGGHGQPQQVLDGQQRLASIRDFMLNEFSIDGRIEPFDQSIESLHGIRFSSLPLGMQREFLRTPVRMYEITDYRPEEPAEIFFRLNQPTGLTPAEKRNAFFGPVRDQIREVVAQFEDATTNQRSMLGFTNGRMAYDDVFARFACTLEFGTLRNKVTASAVNAMYRRSNPLRDEVMLRLETAVSCALQVMGHIGEDTEVPRLNKATFYSWLLFFARLTATGDLSKVTQFFLFFETVRLGIGPGVKTESPKFAHMDGGGQHSTLPLMPLYSDRASSRVADVSSVVLRDFALWACWFEFTGGTGAVCSDPAYRHIGEFWQRGENEASDQYERSTLEFIENIAWGAEF